MARNSQARKAKKNTVHDEYYIDMENAKAILEGPKKKKWTFHDIKSIKPITEAQRQLFESYYYGNHIVANGSAGTGKTFLALWLGLNSVLNPEEKQKKIIIVRSNVSTGAQVGHLPGSLQEKMEPYEVPYKDILADLCGKSSTYEDMKDAGIIEFMPTAFIRGLTWSDSIIIIDEAQNMDDMSIHSIMTRVGKNSRVFVCGDISQNDLKYDRKLQSGYNRMVSILNKMEDVDTITFTKHDIVRSGFAKAWVIASEEVDGGV